MLLLSVLHSKVVFCCDDLYFPGIFKSPGRLSSCGGSGGCHVDGHENVHYRVVLLMSSGLGL